MPRAAWWIKRLKSGECFLLVGKERLLKKEFIRELGKKHFANLSDATMNTQEWNLAEDPALAPALEFIQTAPFLGEKRIAVLWQIEELEDPARKNLLACLENLPSTSIMVLVSEETSTKKSAFLRDIESAATLVACHTPFDKDFPVWIEARARKMGGTIDREATRRLIAMAGKDTAALQNALETLFVYIHPRTAVSSQDVDKLLGKTSEEDVFAIAEDLFQKDTQSALEKTLYLFREGVRAPEIIAVLAGQLERMKQAAALTERGASPQEVASAFRVHSFFQQKFFLQLKKLSVKGISRLQKRLLECDLSIKEGRLAERLALEKFILES